MRVKHLNLGIVNNSLSAFSYLAIVSPTQFSFDIYICLFCTLVGIGFFRIHSIVEYISVYESYMLFVSIFQSSVGPFSRYTTTLWVISLQTSLVDIGVFEYPRESFYARMKPMVTGLSILRIFIGLASFILFFNIEHEVNKQSTEIKNK